MDWIYIFLITLAIILILFVINWLCLIAPRMKDRPSFDKLKKFDYAHRGFHNKEFPENTMPAFERAVKRGYGMELDIQITKDKMVVVHHDNNLKRLCGVDEEIKTLNWDEVKELKIADTKYTSPLFTDVLKMVNGKTPIIVELKCQGDINDMNALCETAWEILKDYKGDYCVESFHPMIVTWFKNNHPEVIRGQLMAKFTGKKGEEDGYPNPFIAFLARNLCTNVMARPDFEAYDCNERNNISLKLCRKIFKIQEVSWTVRDKETFNKLKKDKCICIFENFDA